MQERYGMDIRLVQDALTGNYIKPNIFLCEVDKTRICRLETTNTKLSAKFNSYSEISFEVAHVYNDLITGETKPFPFYDKIEALRLIEVQGLGYFEIQGPSISGDGIKEIKSITAYSLEYTLSQKYLEDLYNDGTIGSIEAGYIDEVYGGDLPDTVEYPVITLYNPTEPKLSLLHLILEKVYGWSIGYVDVSLQTKSRQFNIDRTSVYDFLMNDVCEMFNCYVVFDTLENTINLYAEALTQTFKGDGVKDTFILSPPYKTIGTVSDDGYKIAKENYEYNSSTGEFKLKHGPLEAAHTLEIISEDIAQWETDVFVSFDNLSQEVSVDYSADDIKTVLTVEYGEGQNIREANLGLPYITDLSYYNTPDWMGQELYDVYAKYNEACEEVKSLYTDNVQERLELATKLDYEENRVSLSYSIVRDVDHTTVTDADNGKVYYVRTGDFPNYNYVEKTLPDEYQAGTTYFRVGSADLTEDKIIDLRKALGDYFANDSMEELDKLVDAGTFEFTRENALPFGDKDYQEGTLLYYLNKHKDHGALKSSSKDLPPEDMYENMDIYSQDAQERDSKIKEFLDEILDQFGTNMLGVIKDMYVTAREGFIEGWNAAQDAKEEAGEKVDTPPSESDNDDDEGDEMTEEDREEVEQEIRDSAKDYPNYYPIVLILEVIEEEIGTSIHSDPPATKSTGRYADYVDKNGQTQLGIDNLTTQINDLIADNASITESLNMDVWFFNYFYTLYEAEYIEENNIGEDDEIPSEVIEKLKSQARTIADSLLMRLSPFLREDELVLDDIVSTELDTIVESLSIQEDALTAAYLELQKISQPQLKFSMTMANIYALPEFAPIVNQFQLGNLIKVAIRPDYIKQSRLMQVDMGLDDFSSFSCEFGELTSLRSQSDIHADLLSQAASAGKQVATNSSYWTKGSDIATTTDLKIQQGLLDATTAIKSIDGTQDIVIDKYGIHLQKKDPDTGVIHPEQAKFVNNSLLFTKDGWKTSSTGLGKFTVDGETFYGLIAEAVLAGYIEGSKIVGSEIEGGTLKIGKYIDDYGEEQWVLNADEDGTLSIMDFVHFYKDENGKWNNSLKNTIGGVQNQIADINSRNKYDIKVLADGPTTITAKDEMTILTCKVYSWDTDITNLTDASLFHWKRKSANSISFIGDGIIKEFNNIPNTCQIGAVYINDELIAEKPDEEYADDQQYYSYNIELNTIMFTLTPEDRSIIEVVDSRDLAWNNDHQGQKAITITHDDVDENANITCEVDLPESE